MSNRSIARDANALASSIVLACRPRPEHAPVATRREFITELRRELERELPILIESNISPVDLAQATIGPGLAVFTRYAAVVEADGRQMRVRTALALINDELDRVLRARDERLDPDTRFCVAWYEQFGYTTQRFGLAETMALAKGVVIRHLDEANVLSAQSGKVRLLKREEFPPDWNPETDRHVAVWECLQQMILRLERAGVEGAGELLAQIGDDRGERSKELAVRLYEIADRRRMASDAFSYNQYAREYAEIRRTLDEDVVRYDNFVREYPEIRKKAEELRGQLSLELV